MECSPQAEISHRITNGVLQVSVSGPASIEDIVAYTLKNLDVWAEYPCLLWDFRKMSFVHITAASVQNMTKTFSSANDARKGGRSAMLVLPGEGYGLARMIKSYSELNASPVLHNVFHSEQAAYEWLEKAMSTAGSDELG